MSTWTGANLAAVLFPTAETLRQVQPLAQPCQCLPRGIQCIMLLAHPSRNLIMNPMGKLQGERVHLRLAWISDVCVSLSAIAKCCASGALAAAEQSAMRRCGRLLRRGRMAW